MLPRRPYGPHGWSKWSAALALSTVTLVLYAGHHIIQRLPKAAEDAAVTDQASIVSNSGLLRQAASALDPNALELAPRDGVFESKFKNPCWWHSVHTTNLAAGAEQLLCLPFVYLTGFYTGIGSLIDKLHAHPNVVKDAGPIGIWGTSWGYWSEHRNVFYDYLKGIFAAGATPLALQREPSTNIVIDSARSTFYLYQAASSHAHRAFLTVAVAEWKKCHDQLSSGPLYEQCMDQQALPRGRAADYKVASDLGLDYRDLQLPLLMKAIYGQRTPRLVLMVRNPIHRMYSNYFGVKNMWERHGNTTQGFTKFVTEQLAAWQACLVGKSTAGLDGAGGEPAAHTDWDCYMHFETLSMREEAVFYHCDQLFRGLYAPYLKEWLRYLPRDHVLVLKASEYFKQPDAVTNKVLAFLGLPQLPTSSVGSAAPPTGVLDQQIAASIKAAGLPPRSNTQGVPPMEEPTRLALLEFYKPYNVQLAELLHDPSILAWNTDKAAA